MALNGHSDILWHLLALIWHHSLSWQLPAQAQTVYLMWTQDPSNVFNEAVDGPFQGPLMAVNGWSDMPWHRFALIWHPVLGWQLPALTRTVYPTEMRAPSSAFRMQFGGPLQPILRKNPNYDFFFAFFMEWGCVFGMLCKSPLTGPA